MGRKRMDKETRFQEKRSFLKGAINAAIILIAAAIGAAGTVSLLPGDKARRKERLFPLVDADEAPRRGAREYSYRYDRDGRELEGRVLLVRAPEGLIALSPSCTHLGCTVVWHREKKEFLCPCHGGRYDISGKNIEGPPPSPLRRFALETREGMIYARVPV
jgi:Rieske Fe-S protein